MNAELLREMSVRLERETGYDSIPTMERVYARAGSGAYRCAYSSQMTYGADSCTVLRHDVIAMWRHVHFGKHGRSFHLSFEELFGD